MVADTVTAVWPRTGPRVAEMVLVPRACGNERPLELVALEMAMTEGALDAQVTCCVSDWVLPSE